MEFLYNKQERLLCKFMLEVPENIHKFFSEIPCIQQKNLGSISGTREIKVDIVILLFSDLQGRMEDYGGPGANV